MLKVDRRNRHNLRKINDIFTIHSNDTCLTVVVFHLFFSIRMDNSAAERKLEKSLARFKERIENGSYYEAEQTIRSIVSRYLRSSNFTLAIDLLYKSLIILLEFKKYDESSDLYLLLLEVMSQEQDFTDGNLNKILNILNFFPSDNLNLLNLTKETTKFIQNITKSEVGFVKLNSLLGEKLINSNSVNGVNLGEKLLFLTNDLKCLELIINYEYNSFKTENDSSKFYFYVYRTIVPYLLIKNLKFAELGIIKLLEKFLNEFNEYSYMEIDNLKIFNNEQDELSDNLKIINFLQLLINLLKSNSNVDAFKLLLKRYSNVLKIDEILFSAVNEISNQYYNYTFIQKQSNMLQNMMSSFLGGGTQNSIAN